VDAVRAELSEAAFVAAWDVGRALSLAQVLAVVQAIREEPTQKLPTVSGRG
jgi:hypothetical protein